MPTPRRPLPAHLRSRPFTLAEARAAGMTRQETRHPSLRRPYRGVLVPDHLPDDLRTRCVAASLVLPPATAFGAATAATLLGLPLPAAVDPARHHDPVLDVVVPPGARSRLPRTRATTGRSPGRPAPVGRLVLVPPAAAWAGLGGVLSVDDLVVLGDAVARRVGRGRLRSVLDAPGQLVGRSVLEQAYDLVRDRVDSPQETRLRLVVVRGGIPEPEVNRDAFDDRGGWLAVPDLGWHAQQVALEYLGDVHRTAKGRWRKDVRRREVLEDNGWVVHFATADDLRAPAELLARVAGSLRSRGLSWP
ncbi:hypothetical protein GCM10028777_18490 [Angustibacter speluncae]